MFSIQFLFWMALVVYFDQHLGASYSIQTLVKIFFSVLFLKDFDAKMIYCIFLHVFVRLCFLFSLFSSVSDGKSCLSSKQKFISTSKRREEHLFAGRNTQHMYYFGVEQSENY